jgi:BTB/POZ domain
VWHTASSENKGEMMVHSSFVKTSAARFGATTKFNNLISQGRCQHRLPFSESSKANASFSTSKAVIESTASEFSTSQNPNQALLAAGLVERHGKGDAVIRLNVGGKEFCTLRSTVAANPVLTEHVTRAEANSEFTHGGNAVFIDRDPTHFHIILNFLRNEVEGLSYYRAASKSKSLLKKQSKEYRVQLPKDINALRDIYVEASHYQITSLVGAACEQNVLVSVLGAFGGGGNPFDRTARVFQMLRRSVIAVGGMGTLAVGSQQDPSKLFPALFPSWSPKAGEETKERDKEKDDGNVAT